MKVFEVSRFDVKNLERDQHRILAENKGEAISKYVSLVKGLYGFCDSDGRIEQMPIFVQEIEGELYGTPPNPLQD